MKKLKLLFINKQLDFKLFNKLLVSNPLLTIKNKIKKTDDKIFAKYNNRAGKIDVEIVFEEILLDEIFYQYLCNLIWSSHQKVEELKSDEGMYGTYEQHYSAIESTVQGLFLQWQNEKKLNILKICADVLENIARNHKFPNGNKRTALISVIALLKFFGLYLKYSGFEDYLNTWEDIITAIVANKNYNTLIMLEKNIMISFTYKR